MKFVEISERNIERAIKKGLEQLNTTLDMVDVKVLNEGGFLSKAKVRITLLDGTENEIETPVMSVKNDVVPKIKNDKKAEALAKKQEKIEKNTKIAEKIEQIAKNVASESQNSFRVHEPRVQVSHEENVKNALNFINGLFEVLNIKADIKAEPQEENTIIRIIGEQAGELIGYRGEALSSLQFLVNNITQREENSRIIIDIENYREKREDTLKELAVRLAHKAVKTGKIVKLEPMNAYERKIIHTALQDDTMVKTISKGEEPNRYLLIIPNNENPVVEAHAQVAPSAEVTSTDASNSEVNIPSDDGSADLD